MQVLTPTGWLGFAFAGVALLGCGDDSTSGPGCTEIGCVDSLVLEFSSPGGFGDGDWTITADGGVPGTCEFPIVDGSNTDDCDGMLLQIKTLPIQLAWRLTNAPEQVQVMVQKDGVAVLDMTVTPAYEQTQPNGPDCPPVCLQATERLVVED